MVGNIVGVGWATIKSGCLPITAELVKLSAHRRELTLAPPVKRVLWFGNIAHLSEDHVEKTVSLITEKTSELLKNYISMTVDLQHVEKQEEVLFQYIDKIVKAEANSVSKVECLARSIDRITVMNTKILIYKQCCYCTQLKSCTL